MRCVEGMEGEQGGRGGIIGRLASGSLKSLDERFPPAQSICQNMEKRFVKIAVLSRFAFLRLLVMEGIYFIDSYKG